MTVLMGEGREVGAVYFDLTTTFYTASINILRQTDKVQMRCGLWNGLKPGWTDGLTGLWSAAQSPAAGQSLVVYTRNEYGGQF